MTYDEAAWAAEGLMPGIRRLYGMEDWRIARIERHEGGRNVAYRCFGEEGTQRILRVSYLPDRDTEAYLAETEYVRYLAEGGAGVADVISSRDENLAEPVVAGGNAFCVCVFERAKGDCIADRQYRYRPGAPLSEYFYNCGKTLGRMHALSKRYAPVHRRPDFFDRFNEARFDELIPGEFAALKPKLSLLLAKLRALPQDGRAYGMVHFDFSDGNYNIDYDTGDITAFDFDNSCFCWYLYDLANLWAHGVGWAQFEPDAERRRAFMDEYYRIVIDGYRSETDIADTMLAQTPLLIQAVLMEGIVDEFECMRNEGEGECGEEQRYRIRLMLGDIPYMGFFDPSYSVDSPFCDGV